MVGHTHDDIDGRFGVLSQHIRNETILTPQQFETYATSAFKGECKVTYVAAIFAYKVFYDQFIDPLITVKKQDYTNLGFRFQTLSEQDKVDPRNQHLIDLNVKVNYRKCAQDFAVDLRMMNPVYNATSQSTEAEWLYPVVQVSRWIPQESIYGKDRRSGIAFMTKKPTGCPGFLKLEPWSDKFRSFIAQLRTKYPLAKDDWVFDQWYAHLLKEMPIKPNGKWPPEPSDDIRDFAMAKRSDFKPPLGKYLYGDNPIRFFHLHRSSVSTYDGEGLRTIACSDVHPIGSSINRNERECLYDAINELEDTSTLNDEDCNDFEYEDYKDLEDFEPGEFAFTDKFRNKSTHIDEHIRSVVVQAFQTIPHQMLKEPYRIWKHNFPEMLQKVIVRHKIRGPNKKLIEVFSVGTICAGSDDDIDHGMKFLVCIDNPTDSAAMAKLKTILIDVETEYYEARMRYREAHHDSESRVDENWDARRSRAQQVRAKAIAKDQRTQDALNRSAAVFAEANQYKEEKSKKVRKPKAARIISQEEQEQKELLDRQKQMKKAERELVKADKLRQKQNKELKKSLASKKKVNKKQQRGDWGADDENDESDNDGMKNDVEVDIDKVTENENVDIDNNDVINEEEANHENKEQEEEQNEEVMSNGTNSSGSSIRSDTSMDSDDDNFSDNVNNENNASAIKKGSSYDQRDCEDIYELKPESVINQVLENIPIAEPKITYSRANRRVVSSYNIDMVRCECGCGASYEANQMKWCQGGRRNVQPTACRKRIGPCRNKTWLCSECPLIVNDTTPHLPSLKHSALPDKNPDANDDDDGDEESTEWRNADGVTVSRIQMIQSIDEYLKQTNYMELYFSNDVKSNRVKIDERNRLVQNVEIELLASAATLEDYINDDTFQERVNHVLKVFKYRTFTIVTSTAFALNSGSLKVVESVHSNLPSTKGDIKEDLNYSPKQKRQRRERIPNDTIVQCDECKGSHTHGEMRICNGGLRYVNNTGCQKRIGPCRNATWLCMNCPNN